MTIELPDDLEVSVRAQAQARGVRPDLYIREVLERDIESANEPRPELPLKSGIGMWAEYGLNISDEEIAANRAEMFRGFGEDF